MTSRVAICIGGKPGHSVQHSDRVIYGRPSLPGIRKSASGRRRRGNQAVSRAEDMAEKQYWPPLSRNGRRPAASTSSSGNRQRREAAYSTLKAAIRATS